MIRSFQGSDLNLLHVFIAVVENGGFSAAELALNSRVSRISTQMADLEARLGLQLCHRGRSGFSLTKEGRVIFEEAERLFLAIDDFRLKASETQKRLAGEVRLGLCDNLVTNPDVKVSEAIARFKQRDNNVHFDLRIETPLGLETGVLNGRLHLAIGLFHHRVQTLHYEPLTKEVHHLYCGRNHPLFNVSDTRITANKLLEFDYANRRQAEMEGELASEFGTRGSATSDDMEALTFLILSGAYLAYLPEDSARQWVERGDIRPILPDELRQEATLHLVTRKRFQHGRAVRTFIRDLLSIERQ